MCKISNNFVIVILIWTQVDDSYTNINSTSQYNEISLQLNGTQIDQPISLSLKTKRTFSSPKIVQNQITTHKSSKKDNNTSDYVIETTKKGEVEYTKSSDTKGTKGFNKYEKFDKKDSDKYAHESIESSSSNEKEFNHKKYQSQESSEVSGNKAGAKTDHQSFNRKTKSSNSNEKQQHKFNQVIPFEKHDSQKALDSKISEIKTSKHDIKNNPKQNFPRGRYRHRNPAILVPHKTLLRIRQKPNNQMVESIEQEKNSSKSQEKSNENVKTEKPEIKNKVKEKDTSTRDSYKKSTKGYSKHPFDWGYESYIVHNPKINNKNTNESSAYNSSEENCPCRKKILTNYHSPPWQIISNRKINNNSNITKSNLRNGEIKKINSDEENNDTSNDEIRKSNYPSNNKKIINKDSEENNPEDETEEYDTNSSDESNEYNDSISSGENRSNSGSVSSQAEIYKNRNSSIRDKESKNTVNKQFKEDSRENDKDEETEASQNESGEGYDIVYDYDINTNDYNLQDEFDFV